VKEAKVPVRVEVSYKTVLFTIGVVLGLWLLFLVKDIIILIFLSIIVVSALLAPVEWLHSKKIPRPLSVLIVYFFLIILISAVISIIVPPLVAQTGELVKNLPNIIGTVNDFLVFNKIPVNDTSNIIGNQLNTVGNNLVSISSKIFSSIFLLITLFALSFYLLLEWRVFVRLVSSPFTGKQEKRISNLVFKVEKGLGAWVRGQLALSGIIAVTIFIGLTILGVPYALPLAIIAGILEIVPIVGPIVSAIPAVLVGLTVSPLLGLAIVALFFIVQQLEGHIVVPMLMSKVVGLQPAIIIVSVLAGATLAGIAGALLAIPVILVAKIIVKDLFMDDPKAQEDLKEI
jgi:predicted PurR-regulated permease PerM